MTEKLLHFIWQYNYYNSAALHTADGQLLQVIFPGNYNTNQGPDFLDARINVSGTIWIGSIELHVHSSEWMLHRHSVDKNYQNVILHVVWKNDVELSLPFPVLELQDIVPKLLLKKYTGMMDSPHFIPCGKQVVLVKPVTISKWKERLLAERLEYKSAIIAASMNDNNRFWEEAFWWMLARNFGMKINADAFESIARSIPVRIINRHRNNQLQLEAFLFGQAGLLNEKFTDEYPRLLKNEFEFLQKKYHLFRAETPVFFLRMRPANFPSVRLAQLAALIYKAENIFSTVIRAKSLELVEQLFAVTASEYWDSHYVFDEAAVLKKKNVGKQMVHNMLINTIIPFVFAYGYLNKEEKFQSLALNWMEEIPPEKNNVCNGFEEAGLVNANAFDSQAFIQLKNFYCNQKRCLECSIGNEILKC